MFPSESQRKRCRNRKTWCGACVNLDASVPNSINIQDTRYINIAVAVIEWRESIRFTCLKNSTLTLKKSQIREQSEDASENATFQGFFLKKGG